MVIRTHFEIEETAVTIVSEPEFVQAARDAIFEAREEVKRFIRTDPTFLHTLEPYDPPDDAPPIVRRMCFASKAAEVGPMAAIAGAIAEEAVHAMVKRGARQAIVDNGGDIAMRIARPVTVGIFAGSSPIRDAALRFAPEEGIISVCTSSGTVGHSLSFGRADAAVAIAKDAALADAAATALGNGVKSKDAAAIEAAMAPLHAAGIRGMLVIIGDLLVASGEVPPIVRANVDHERITKG